MNDIVFTDADPKQFGFDSFFNLNIEETENTVSAVNFKNKKMLIRLKDHLFDEGSIKQIAEKKKLCFVIDLSQIIDSRGLSRAVRMSKLRNFLSLCNKHGAYYAMASFSRRKEDIRSASELCHIAMLLGLNRGQAEFALNMIRNY